MIRRTIAVLAALSLLVMVPPALNVPAANAGPAADAIAALEAQVQQNTADIAALNARVTALEERPWPTSTPSPTLTPTSTPSPTIHPSPTPSPTQTPTPTAPLGSTRVTSIPALLNALADNNVTDITVANGTYHVSRASQQTSDSLWIGSRFASRTRPVTVHAETVGGVTFDGGGTAGFGCISFEAGAHDQTWDGFTCAHGAATQTGVITFGGYSGLASPHHITLSHWTITATCTGSATSAAGPATDHAIYTSLGSPHDLLFEDITVDGRGGLASALHGDHSPNAYNLTARRFTVTGTQQAFIIWDHSIHDWTIEDSTVTNPLLFAVRYENGGTGIVLRNLVSTGSRNGQGFYSDTGGANPPGVTFINDSLH